MSCFNPTNVKLAKWKDVNYWALKQSGDKTHQTLYKYTVKYRNILKAPVYYIFFIF